MRRIGEPCVCEGIGGEEITEFVVQLWSRDTFKQSWQTAGHKRGDAYANYRQSLSSREIRESSFYRLEKSGAQSRRSQSQ